MSRILASNDYSLDFDQLYVRMWDLAIDDKGDGTRLYQPDSEQALKWLIVELAGTPATPGKTWPDNNSIRQQAHAALADGCARRLTPTTFRLLKQPAARVGEYGHLHDIMSVIPRGSWTAYGELGELVGIHPKGLGSHIKSCSDCPNAVRVLQSHGQMHGPGFRWSEPDRADDPNDVLREEGIRFNWDRADPDQFVDAANLTELLLERNTVARFAWPTVEWVKVPIALKTDEPSGSAIQMRHFLDCSHWFRDGDNNLRGAPPTLATDEQMRTLAACGTCVKRAVAASHAEHGPRLVSASDTPEVYEFDDDLVDATELLGHNSTDGTALTAVRREQTYLRRRLLDGRVEAPCALCGRTLPARVLVAAHITPRHLLGEAERLNFLTAAMLACSLGCDALFEYGYIAVDDNALIVEHRAAANDALHEAVAALVGRTVPAHKPATAARFRKHRNSLCLTPSDRGTTGSA